LRTPRLRRYQACRRRVAFQPAQGWLRQHRLQQTDRYSQLTPNKKEYDDDGTKHFQAL
jgi:hypothetical protein